MLNINEIRNTCTAHHTARARRYVSRKVDGIAEIYNGKFGAGYKVYTFNYGNKDISVQNCQYVRLKNLVVGYTLPAKLASKLTVSKVRVYFSGDDLWELTSVKDGFDPEYGEASNSTLPFTRLLSVGLDVTF